MSPESLVLEKLELQRLLFCLIITLVSKAVALSHLFLSSSFFLIPLYFRDDLALYQKQNKISELIQIPFFSSLKPICISIIHPCFPSCLTGRKYLSETSPFNSALNPKPLYLQDFVPSIILILSPILKLSSPAPSTLSCSVLSHSKNPLSQCCFS